MIILWALTGHMSLLFVLDTSMKIAVATLLVGLMASVLPPFLLRVIVPAVIAVRLHLLGTTHGVVFVGLSTWRLAVAKVMEATIVMRLLERASGGRRARSASSPRRRSRSRKGGGRRASSEDADREGGSRDGRRDRSGSSRSRRRSPRRSS
ncbi:unnamed protein product, partial [Prorocentrum cordatum]